MRRHGATTLFAAQKPIHASPVNYPRMLWKSVISRDDPPISTRELPQPIVFVGVDMEWIDVTIVTHGFSSGSAFVSQSRKARPSAIE